jgi:hypothetical protein
MDYWQHHGMFFLLGCAIFPRITTLFFSGVSFGFWHVIGWILAPRLLVAILATVIYWHSNPILCVGAWLFAVGGTSTEATVANRTVKRSE